MKKIQIKGLIPTLDQFKFIYGITIMSRFMVARDKDELRESIVKDTWQDMNVKVNIMTLPVEPQGAQVISE